MLKGTETTGPTLVYRASGFNAECDQNMNRSEE